MNEANRRVGTIVSYAQTSIGIVVNLLYVPLLLHLIGESEYGLYQMIGSVISALSIIEVTVSTGAIRFYCKYYTLDDEEGMANVLGTLKRYYRFAYLFFFVAAAICSVVLPRIYQGSLSPTELAEIPPMMLVLGFNLIVGLDSTLPIAVITAHEEFLFLKLTQILQVVLQIPVALFLATLRPYALTICIVQTLVNTLVRFLQHAYAKKRLSMDSRLRFRDGSLEHELLLFMSGIVLGTIADQVFWKTDQLILGYFNGTANVAVYSVGMIVASTFGNLGVAISPIFAPRASELWTKHQNMSELSDLFRRVSRAATLPVLLILTGFTIFGRDFIRLWAGESFGQAWFVAMIVMWPFSIDVIQNFGLIVLQVIGRYAFRANVYAFAALANLALTLLLVPSFGNLGAAFSTALAISLSSGIILNLYYHRSIGIDMKAFWTSEIKEGCPLLVLCGVGLFVWRAWVGTVGWFGLAVGIAVYSVLFCFVAYLFCLNDSERGRIRSLFSDLRDR